MITRRSFLSLAATGGAAIPLLRASSVYSAFSPAPLSLTAPLIEPKAGETLVTILHTNDQHSQIDPLPASYPKYGGKGGVARRATLVKRIRAENPNTLLVDAGDVFQGTPYFNLYRGEVEYRAMTAIGYDVATLGNHDFDNGVEALAEAMKFAKFDFVSANYDASGTTIAERVKPYVVREFKGIRIGIFGLGIKLEGLNPPESFRGVKYLDPVRMARGSVSVLREREKCAMVVCLSHLGYYTQPQKDRVGDAEVASEVDGIDFIAGGHTHTFMKSPVTVKQPSGKNTVIFQAGESGIYLGRVDFTLRGNRVTASAGRLLDLRDDSLT